MSTFDSEPTFQVSPATGFGSPAFPFEYAVVPGWFQCPAGVRVTEITAVAVDAQDRVFVFNRGDPPVLVLSPEGRLLKTWGAGAFRRPHGISMGEGETVWCTDDLDHTVRQFTLEGGLLKTLGESGRPSDTGATSVDYRSIQRAGPPFHYPTNAAVAPNGDLYVSDGYGNARIHRFSRDGVLLKSWGAPGARLGEFHVPHGIAVRGDGVVLVADRENCRIQFFSPDGEALEEWRGIARPCQMVVDSQGWVYVAELGFRSGMWPGTRPPFDGATGGRVSIFDATGKRLCQWGGGVRPEDAGDFFAPHDIRLDSKGDLYVSEVVWSAGANRGHVSPTCHTLQKFQLRRRSA